MPQVCGEALKARNRFRLWRYLIDAVMPHLQGLGFMDDLIQGWRDFVAYPWLFYFTPSA